MNLANTIRMLSEKRSDPPFDVSKADYAGAAKELTQYAKTKGGIDKNDFLAFANRMSAIANKKAPRVTAKFARDLMDLDTSPREKIVSVMRSNGIKVTVQGGGFKIEDFTLEELEELDELEEAKVMGREVHDKTFANRTQADNFAKKNGGRVRQVGRVFYVFKEGDEKENDDEEQCPECGEYPCQCDDVKTSESSCGSKRKMNEDFDALFEEAMVSEKMYIVKQNDGTQTVPMSKKDAEDYVKKMSYYNKKAGVNTKYKILPEEAIEEAYKTPAEAGAYEAGKKAARSGKKYDDNPNKKGSKEYTAWSKGHNEARAKGMKEEVELTESPMVTFTVPNVTSDMASKLEKIAKEKNIEYSRKGRTVVLKGKKIDVTMLRTKMGLAQTNIPMVPVKEEVELDEARDPSKSGGSGYDLYHKDFSSAMKHAYDYAKKKFGIEIDPKEIDDKVASGPRKPSAGKTNSYRLKGKDGKKGVQIQVANLDNKKYELNMYKEEVEMNEAREDTPRKVARLILGMGVRQNAPESEILKKIPFALKKLGLQNDKLIQRDPDFKGEVIDDFRSMKEEKEDIDMQEEQKISLEEAIMQAVFGEAKKAPVTKKDDDGDGMDPVGKEDGDVDNDGDKDDSDKYLKNRRKAVGKAMKKSDKDDDEKSVGKSGKMDKVDTKPALDEEVSPEVMKMVQKYMDSSDVARLKRYAADTRGLRPDEQRDKAKIIAVARGRAKAAGMREEVERIMESFEPNRFAQYGDRAEQVMELTAIKMAEKKHK